MLERGNKFIEKWMAFVTPLCMLVGICFPDVAAHGLPYVTTVFAFITFTGALKSEFKDVLRVFRDPKPLLSMLVMIHVVIPTIACVAGHLFFGTDPYAITGMVLEFSVPTAVIGLMWVTIYNGNNPLSLSLVVVDTILAPFLIPVTLRVLVGSQVKMDAMMMMKQLLFMVALPAIAAMALNQVTHGAVKNTWPKKLAIFSKFALMFVVTSNSSKVAPYVRQMNLERVAIAGAILVLAAGSYALGWLVARLLHKDKETTISMIYGTGMRNISAGAVIAGACFPGAVMYPVMIGTLFQQVLAAFYGKALVSRLEN